jgi:hypothetical protein
MADTNPNIATGGTFSGSPGQPLNPSQLAIASGLPVPSLQVASHTLIPGQGTTSMVTPDAITVPLVKAQYSAQE